MTDIPDLDKPCVCASYDPQKRIIFIQYRGILEGDAIRAYYRWLMQDVEPVLKTVRGAVFDFRDVERIEVSNTRTVTQSSRGVHLQVDLRHIGVALIAKDHYQEQLLRVTSEMTPHPHTKRVVQDMDAALAYIDEWQNTLLRDDQSA
jgi:hypothetical protein